MLIGLAGRMGSGKDTIAQILVSERGFKRVAFADAVRDAVYALDPQILTGSNSDDLYSVQFLVDSFGWDHCKREYPEIRRLMQRMGTEVGRDLFGENIWIEIAFEKFRPSENVVITDVRFPNEVNAVLDDSGVLVWVDRESNEANQVTASHASENSVGPDDPRFMKLQNHGTIDELKESVLEMVDKLAQLRR